MGINLEAKLWKMIEESWKTTVSLKSMEGSQGD